MFTLNITEIMYVLYMVTYICTHYNFNIIILRFLYFDVCYQNWKPLNRNILSRLTQFNEYSPIIRQFYETKNLRQIWRVGPFVFVDNVAHTSRCQRSPSPHPVTDTLRQFRVLDLSKLLHVFLKLLHVFFKLLRVFLPHPVRDTLWQFRVLVTAG